MFSKIALASSVLAVARAQQIGTYTAEVHPALTWEKCTSSGCTTVDGSVTIDSNWRWTHGIGTSTNCYTGNTWDATFCPNDAACAVNCAVEGANYESTYGVTTSGNSLKIDFVTQSSQANIGSRLFLMASDTEYQTFNLLNQEFTFDVNVAKLPCGLNGALYMSGMSADGGVSAYPNNKAGAQYGVGYCDSQCPRDLKWIDGQGNVDGWVPSSNNVNTGVGNHGSCCAEMDIWEANSISTALTPHSCDTASQTECIGNACGGTYSTDRYGGTCDPDGCDFNPYRVGDETFYGPGMTVNTNEVFTVVTQFLTDTGTASGTLNQIKRFYVQNGVVIPNPNSQIAGITGNSITETYCTETKSVFNSTDSWDQHGGFTSMTDAFNNGMVLVLSLWDDYDVNMLWLDSDYPTTESTSSPGVARGTCSTSSGVPATVEADDPGAYVVYSNIKVGSINSTFTGTLLSSSSSSTSATSTSTSSRASSSSVKTTSTTLTTSTKKTSTSTSTTLTTSTTKTSTSTSTSTTSSASSTNTALAPLYGQCGGYPGQYTGPTACVSPYVCVYSNPWYSQCLT